MKFYVDTSVWGGHEDEEFEEWTIPFFEQARQGRFSIVLTDLTLRELMPAPERVYSPQGFQFLRRCFSIENSSV